MKIDLSDKSVRTSAKQFINLVCGRVQMVSLVLAHMNDLIAKGEKYLVSIILFEALKNGYLKIGTKMCDSIGIALFISDEPGSLTDAIATGITIDASSHMSDTTWLNDLVVKHIGISAEQWIAEYSQIEGIDEVLGQFPHTLAFGDSKYASAIDPLCTPIRQK